MKKQTNLATNTPEVEPEIRSLKDAGYQSAKSREGSVSSAEYVFKMYPSFHETQPDEAVDQLVEGFKLRFYEFSKEYRGDKFYKMDGETPIPVPEGTAGATMVNVNVAMAYTQQAYGKLKDTNPGLHKALKGIRDGFNKYKSENLKTIIRQCRILAKPEGAARGATKGFLEALNAMFESYDKRVKSAKDRGDATADPVKFRVARDAFLKAYNV